MSLPWKLQRFFRFLPLTLLLILILACEPKDTLTGVYKAEGRSSPRQAEAVLELKPNGNGVWKVGDEEVPFAWYIKDGELRVNTKAGGVIVGDIDKDTIFITIPGTERMAFQRVQP